MNFDRLVALARAHESPDDSADTTGEVVAAAERIEGEWRRRGWDGGAFEPRLPFAAAAELDGAVTVSLYGALVAQYLKEDGYEQAEHLVPVNSAFVRAIRANGTGPREAADLAHQHLEQTPRPVIRSN